MTDNEATQHNGKLRRVGGSHNPISILLNFNTYREAAEELRVAAEHVTVRGPNKLIIGEVE